MQILLNLNLFCKGEKIEQKLELKMSEPDSFDSGIFCS